MQNTSKVDELIAALQSKGIFVRCNAAEALGEIGEPAVPALIKELSDENWEVRAFAASALGRIGTSEAKEALEGFSTR